MNWFKKLFQEIYSKVILRVYNQNVQWGLVSMLSKTMLNAFCMCLKLKVGTKLKWLWCIKCVSIVHCVLDARDHLLKTAPLKAKRSLHFIKMHTVICDCIIIAEQTFRVYFHDAGTVYTCEHTFYKHLATSRLCRAAHKMHSSAGVLCRNFTRPLSQGMPCTFL